MRPFFPGNTYGFDWYNKPVEGLAEFKYECKAIKRCRLMPFIKKVHINVTSVYCRNERVFNELLQAWNSMGNTPSKLNPNLTWHYKAV